jgi:hypothetical protein
MVGLTAASSVEMVLHLCGFTRGEDRDFCTTEAGCPSHVLAFRNLGVRIMIYPMFADVEARACSGPQDYRQVCLNMKPAGVFC